MSMLTLIVVDGDQEGKVTVDKFHLFAKDFESEFKNSGRHARILATMILHQCCYE